MDLELKAKKASQKRAFGKNMMEELRREYYEGPEEVHVRMLYACYCLADGVRLI